MQKPRQNAFRSWTYIGAGAVALAVTLAAVGLALAIGQTRSVASHRVAELRPDAVALVDQVNDAIVGQLRSVLRDAAGRHDAVSAGGRPAPMLNRPAWIPVIFIHDRSLPFPLVEENEGVATADVHRIIKLVTPRLDLRIQSSSEKIEDNQVQFMHDQVRGEPVVVAHMMTASAGSPLVVAALLDTGRLKADLVAPLLAARERLALEDGPPNREMWSEPLGPALPFWSVRPSQDYVDSQHRLAGRQRTLYVVITVLTLLALLAVVWAMNQVVRREIALGQLKSDFVADVSHELKTPLALIQMFGETLLEDRVRSEEKKREYYQIIMRETRRLTHMINNILDFSRSEAGKKQYRMERVRMEDVVQQTYEAYRHELDHKGFTHSLKVAAGLPEVKADADAMSQAVLNLINNAIKYSDDDRFLELELLPETRRGREGVLISVRDRGIGIRPEDRAHVFDGFFRAADDKVRKRRGAGLGLSLVRDIVEAHQGFVDVEPRLVKGTTFLMFVPRCTENREDNQNG